MIFKNSLKNNMKCDAQNDKKNDTQNDIKNASMKWRAAGVSILLVIVLLFLPGGLRAATYYVWGHVYSAASLAEGVEMPENPLSPVFAANPERIVGSNLVPLETRNMVKVRIINDADQSEFGSYIVRHGGGYLIYKSGGTGDMTVRFVVEELATGKTLLESGPQVISPGTAGNTRFLLIPESLITITGDREFAVAPTAGKYTGIFTRVGKIELETEVSGSSYRIIDNTTGEATVPGSVAQYLHIPDYQDSPFGGYLYLFGAFSAELYDRPTQVFYRVFRYVDGSPATKTYLTPVLEKTKYTVNFSTGKVETKRVQLGPLPAAEAGGYSHCYKLTPIAESNNVFWSFPDQLLLWPTAGLNGKYRVGIEIIDLAAADPEHPGLFQAIGNFTEFTIKLNNTPPVAKIEAFTDSPGSAESPYVYSCCGGGAPGAPGSNDLLPALVAGSAFPDNYDGGSNPICEILNIEPSPPHTRYVVFRLTAYDANNYLRHWSFWYGRNDGNAQYLLGKNYNGVTNAMADFSGVRISSAQTALSGFQKYYLYVASDLLQPVGPALGSCGYRFVIRAYSRTTNGYYYLWHRGDDDIHYIQR